MKLKLASRHMEAYGFSMRISLSSDYNRYYQVKGSLSAMSWQQRVNESKRQIGLFFLLAILSVFIPVFHFVLVPLFLGLIAWSLWKTRAPRQKLVLEGSHLCFQCGKALPRALSVEEDLHFACPQCSATYTLSLSSSLT